MKKLFFIFISIFPAFAFAQMENKTKIYLKLISECSCTIQMARNDKPAGRVFKMLADTFLFAIEKETTGFFITCGEGITSYLKVPYKPGEGYFRIYGYMGCNSARKNEISITPKFN